MIYFVLCLDDNDSNDGNDDDNDDNVDNNDSQSDLYQGVISFCCCCFFCQVNHRFFFRKLQMTMMIYHNLKK